MADTPSDEQDRRRRRLKEIEPDKVDLVDRAANQRRFLVFKEEAMPNEPEITPTEGAVENLQEAVELLNDLSGQVADLSKKLGGDDPGPSGDPPADPEPAESDPEPEPEPEPEPAVKCDPGAQLREFAEMGLNTAHMMVDFGEMDPALLPTIEQELGRMIDMAAELGVAKSEKLPKLPAPFGEDEPDEAALGKAAHDFMRGLAQDAALLASTAGEEVSDVAKAEIGRIRDNLQALYDGLCVAKGARKFASTLRDVATRALNLCTRAEKNNDVDARTLREARRLRDIVQGLVDRHAAAVSKSEDVDEASMSLQLMDIEGRLDTVEDTVAKGEEDDPEPTPSEDPPADPDPDPEEPSEDEDPPADPEADEDDDPAPAEDEDDDPESEDDPDPDPESEDEDDPTPAEGDDPESEDEEDVEKAEQLKTIEHLESEVERLKGIIVKARKSVGVPASDGADDDPSEGDEDVLLFPMNYNDPAYKEAVAKRAQES